MSAPTLSAEELLAWSNRTADGWRDLLTKNPVLLATPCDIAGAKTVGEVLRHIVAVELRYAERLADADVSDYEAISFDSVNAIYATQDRTAILFQELIASHIDWDERIEFMTRSRGAILASRKIFLFHALLHGIRHYAQLATLVRQHGVAPEWPMDYLFMAMERV